MSNSYIQFKKRRELGEILSDTFTFIRSNYKQLFNVLIRTSLIPFVLVVLASVYYQYSVTTIEDTSISNIFLGVGGMGLAGLLFYASASASIFSFIKAYDSHRHGDLDLDRIVSEAKNKVPSLLGLFLVVYVMFVFGLVFFLIPGIYFIVPLTVVVPLLVIRDTKVFGGIRESFQLISGRWWITFGTILVLGIVIGVMSFAFSVPAIIYTVVKMIITSAEFGSFMDGTNSDIIYLALNAIGTAGSNLLSIVLLVALGFIYYDLDEEKNRTGLRQKIDELDR